VSEKEATARIKINKLLEAGGWRFFPGGDQPANIRLEPSVTIKSLDLDALGEDFEKTGKGFVDFLLLDAKGFPLIVLEAKAEDKNPLAAKEQARKYARSQNCRFVILSNGNLHYFWDLERGNPYVITSFPTPDSVIGYQKVTPDPQRLIAEQVGEDYIALTQRPNYQSEAGWKNDVERPAYIQANKLRFLRPYQLKAIQRLQAAVGDGKDRFLFEMATGTGKTLTAGPDVAGPSTCWPAPGERKATWSAFRRVPGPPWPPSIATSGCRASICSPTTLPGISAAPPSRRSRSGPTIGSGAPMRAHRSTRAERLPSRHWPSERTVFIL